MPDERECVKWFEFPWLRVVEIIALRIVRSTDVSMVFQVQRTIKFDGHESRYTDCQVDQKVVRETTAGQMIVCRIVIQNK
ncbi:hypothetical protein WS50_08040 [Burkholderia territorii]|nr:hypothetical protein WS47_02895 [Burkholderia territorii]KUZ20932.1 hypothetical protein WS50_08040 [Burkholderia territorii]